MAKRGKLLWLGLILASGVCLQATQPPRTGERWPNSYREFVRSNRTALSTRSFVPLVQRIQANRESVRTGVMTRSAAEAAGGIMVSGTRAVPVLLATFNNTASDPYSSGNLQRELFDGPWPTGTMTDYYREISYGTFTVTGTVFSWKKLPRDDTFYEGPGGCNGICNNSKVPDFVRETLSAQDAVVNFGQYDNDGPDGVPNSGDDDGFVDFVAFVHPERGGECGGGGNNNIWSHRFSLSGWGSAVFSSNDSRPGGGAIQVDDYVIMPAVACDGSTMIQIGVFCHEFGHAFGLPDLYDTDDANGSSEGLGNWCLMAGGSWGGDGRSPERPVHMSAWAKAFLGWITPSEVTADLNAASISRLEDSATAFKLPVSANEYYLVYNLRKVLFDQRLPTDGLMIMRVNETVVAAGLATNRVNADENNQGVEVIEADGRRDLDNQANRGDAGDLFPGSANATRFDNTTTPASQGSRAVCDIGSPADTATARLLVSTGTCGGAAPPPPPPSCGSLVGAARPRAGSPRDWVILALPVLAAGAWMAIRRSRRPEPSS